MNSDCAFRIGTTHRVCQDYAVAGTEGEAAYVILADGCSGSPDTDIGARLLVKSAEWPQSSLPMSDWAAWHRAAVCRAAACAANLGLPLTCLDATMLTIQAAGSRFTATCYGDGVAALGRRDGRLEIYAISFAASYPDYAAYLLDDTRRAQWDAQSGNEKRVERWVLGPDGVEEHENRRSEQVCEIWAGDIKDYRFVAVLSDGVQSFTQIRETETSRTTQIVPVTDILASLLAFKGYQGQFVQRRAQAFGKECQGRRWQHSDDLSLGVVWLGD